MTTTLNPLHTHTCGVQTDGWLSEKSASIYEASTETLFLGRQDAMQRQSLVPLHNFMQGRGREGAGTKMLEVACGTGRFATFVKVRLGHCVVGFCQGCCRHALSWLSGRDFFLRRLSCCCHRPCCSAV